MNRRRYASAVVGVVTVTAVGGCLQGEAVLHETGISATSPTTEWDVELDAGARMRLEVERADDSPGRVRGRVHRAATGEEIASATADGSDETFEVPADGTYTVSVDARGSTGEVVLRELE